MIGHVKVVGIMMLINGILLCLMGTYQAAQGPLQMALGGGPGGPGAGGPAGMQLIITIVYVALGLAILACGALNIIAGIRTMRFRNRTFSIVALFLNIPPMITCCCMLTGIPMMVYGLIVLFNSDVGRGFEMVAHGATPEEVIGNLTSRYGDVRDDYDDNYDTRRNWEDERRRRRDEDDDDYDRR